MNDTKLIIILTISSLVILFGGIFLVTKSTQTSEVSMPQNAKAHVVNPTSFDWGNISISGGDVTKKFTIKNTGTDVLKLMNVKTSCHCTKAYVTIDGKESPNFGMSGISSWIGKVAPKKEAKLTVIFDPAFHGPQGVGPINRFVLVETNDKGNSKLTFTLTGMVVK